MSRLLSPKTIVILALVLVPVALMAGGAARVIGGKGFPNAHFVIAFALRAKGSVLLAVGLFALSFYSACSCHHDHVPDEKSGYGTDSDGA